MQKHLAQSLINNDLKKSSLTKFNLSKFSNVNLDAEYDYSVGFYSKMNENMHLTDPFWTAYFVTGEEKYLKKILKFIAIWSMNSNKEQHTEINDKVKDLIAQDASLDYAKNIKI